MRRPRASTSSNWAARLEGELDVAAFRDAWRRIVERHAVLRTGFVWQELQRPQQVVWQRVELPWQEHDWRGLPPEEQQRRWQQLLQEDRRRGFELERAPLMRLTLVRVGEQAYRFAWSHHHLLLDGWSLALVLKELLVHYEAQRRGGSRATPARPRPTGSTSPGCVGRTWRRRRRTGGGSWRASRPRRPGRGPAGGGPQWPGDGLRGGAAAATGGGNRRAAGVGAAAAADAEHGGAGGLGAAAEPLQWQRGRLLRGDGGGPTGDPARGGVDGGAVHQHPAVARGGAPGHAAGAVAAGVAGAAGGDAAVRAQPPGRGPELERRAAGNAVVREPAGLRELPGGPGAASGGRRRGARQRRGGTASKPTTR